LQSYGGLKSQDLEILLAIFAFFKRSLMVEFSKLCSESLHGDIYRWCYVQMSSDWKSVKKNSAASQTVATVQIAPKICWASPQQCAHSAPNFIQINSLSAEL